MAGFVNDAVYMMFQPLRPTDGSVLKIIMIPVVVGMEIRLLLKKSGQLDPVPNSNGTICAADAGSLVSASKESQIKIESNPHSTLPLRVRVMVSNAAVGAIT